MNKKKSKYFNIYKQIKELLLEGKYEYNSFLPSEKKLMEQFDASKDTIRKSLKLLEKDKLIKAVERKGYVCLNSKAYADSLNNLIYNKVNVTHKVISFSIETINQAICDLSGLPLMSNAYAIKRLTYLDGLPIYLDKIYINSNICPDLTKEICEDSIYDYFEELNLSTSCKHRIFNTRIATDKEASVLNIDSTNLIVDVKRYTYDDNGFVFEYSNSVFTPEYFEYFE